MLRYVAELEVERIAAELRVPIGTVKSRLARGRPAAGHCPVLMWRFLDDRRLLAMADCRAPPASPGPGPPSPA